MRQKLTVLIVDDNRTSLALMDMLIRKLPNCATQLQTDPQALLAGVARLDYDLAVIACRRPGFDGIELAQRLKTEAHLMDKPVLLAADAPDPSTWGRARAAGVAEVLAKPIDPVEFRARILELARPTPAPILAGSPWAEQAAAPR